MNRKTIFDAIRAARGRGFDQMEVGAVDNLLDALGVPRESAHRLGPDGADLIKAFESCRLTAYPDPGTGGKPWTIGWGNITDEAGRPIQPGAVWSRQRADRRHEQFITGLEAEVNSLLGNAPTSQLQFDAMMSFAYNLGADIDMDDIAEGLGDSTLLKKHLRGDFTGAAAEFARWNRAGGRVMRGLTRRRAAEADLYRRGSQ